MVLYKLITAEQAAKCCTFAFWRIWGRKERTFIPCKSKTTGESLQAYEIETILAKKPNVQAKHLVGFAHIMIIELIP